MRKSTVIILYFILPIIFWIILYLSAYGDVKDDWRFILFLISSIAIGVLWLIEWWLFARSVKMSSY